MPNELLSALHMEEEVHKDVFEMDRDSIVGLDGFSVAFYQHYYSIIKQDLLLLSRSFLKEWSSHVDLQYGYSVNSQEARGCRVERFMAHKFM